MSPAYAFTTGDQMNSNWATAAGDELHVGVAPSPRPAPPE